MSERFARCPICKATVVVIVTGTQAAPLELRLAAHALGINEIVKANGRDVDRILIDPPNGVLRTSCPLSGARVYDKP